MTTMRDILLYQANCTFDVLKDILENIPERKMNVGDEPREVLGRQALHILTVFDRYSEEDVSWSGRFGKSFGLFEVECDASEIPSRDTILEYLSSVRKQFGAHVCQLSDEHLSKEISNRHGRFRTKMGQYLYMIRHNTLHLGYIRAEMIKRGFNVNEFK